MKTKEQIEVENKMLAVIIHTQNQIATLVHAGWYEFEQEAKNLETKIHFLWTESGREDVPTRELCLWAEAQGMDFKDIFS